MLKGQAKRDYQREYMRAYMKARRQVVKTLEVKTQVDADQPWYAGAEGHFGDVVNQRYADGFFATLLSED